MNKERLENHLAEVRRKLGQLHNKKGGIEAIIEFCEQDLGLGKQLTRENHPRFDIDTHRKFLTQQIDSGRSYTPDLRRYKKALKQHFHNPLNNIGYTFSHMPDVHNFKYLFYLQESLFIFSVVIGQTEIEGLGGPREFVVPNDLHLIRRASAADERIEGVYQHRAYGRSQSQTLPLYYKMLNHIGGHAMVGEEVGAFTGDDVLKARKPKINNNSNFGRVAIAHKVHLDPNLFPDSESDLYS